jgi:hypothetical protein
VAEIGIGSTVWVFDQNRRIYPAERGISGTPIYREFWVTTEIVGETRNSWVLGGYWGKLPKRRPAVDHWAANYRGSKHRVVASQEEVEEDVWAQTHRWCIARRVEYSNPATLRKIAELIGYEPTEVGK